MPADTVFPLFLVLFRSVQFPLGGSYGNLTFSHSAAKSELIAVRFGPFHHHHPQKGIFLIHKRALLLVA